MGEVQGEELALFPEQIPDGPYPRQMLTGSTTVGGLRYVGVGEDPEDGAVVFLGHPSVADVVMASRLYCVDQLWDPDERAARDEHDLSYTWARLITRCEDHLPDAKDDECDACRYITSEDWWLTWVSTVRMDPARFPVTVWRPREWFAS